MRVLTTIMVALAAVASADAQQTINERRAAAPDGVVEVSNISGSVKVTGWDRAEVEVTGTLGRGSERLELTSSGGRTLVKVILPRNARNVDGSDLVLRVPAGSRLEANTVSADVEVDAVRGPLDVETVSGDVAIKGSPREVEAKTVSGGIEVEVPDAPVEARSVSGDVTVRGVRSNLRAQTVSGRIRAEGAAVDRCRVETTSGAIELDLVPQGNADIDVGTVSGEVTVALPAAVGADIRVSTFSGDIDNELGPSAQRTSEHGPGKELSFTTGAGGARLTVKSFSGSVRLRARR